MARFKVGDTVRCIRPGDSNAMLVDGSTYEVSGVSPAGLIYLGSIPGSWYTDRFEHIHKWVKCPPTKPGIYLYARCPDLRHPGVVHVHDIRIWQFHTEFYFCFIADIPETIEPPDKPVKTERLWVIVDKATGAANDKWYPADSDNCVHDAGCVAIYTEVIRQVEA